jgi:hypothetical protein
VHDPRRGLEVHHTLTGNRRVVVERLDRSRIVADRGGHGYVQHPFVFRGREYVRRTYYYDGRAFDRVYRSYYYRGAYLEMYAPAYYYTPAFYGWVYNPWPAPIEYPVAAWGWVGNPWYGYYGSYFKPYPAYASASLWLTDYLLSASLAAAYQAQADFAVASDALPNPAPLTPPVKDLISTEVQRQIALENAEARAGKSAEPDPASSGIQRMLTDHIQHVFIVDKDLDVLDATGNECAISGGDVLQLTGPPPADATSATLAVLARKGSRECPKSVSVTFADLQDMQNHMRETIDLGMAELQAKQGRSGLPSVPPSAATLPQKTELAMNAPPPDGDAPQQINQQWAEADKSEREVAAVVSGAPPAVPVNINLGQSIDEVTTALGQPTSVVNLGAKTIYVYKDVKIIFKGGKVSDVQ